MDFPATAAIPHVIAAMRLKRLTRPAMPANVPRMIALRTSKQQTRPSLAACALADLA
jgi:hypothetical protein